MGKIRVKTIGNEEEEAKEKADKDRKRAEKKAREASAMPANEQSSEKTEEEPKQTEEQPQTPEESKPEEEVKETAEAKPRKTKKEKFLKKANKRSSNYNSKIVEVDKNKTYSLKDGLELLKSLKTAKFDETVELHINTVDAGVSGTVKLPHGNGKEVKVAVADDGIIAEVEQGKINFDILIATPAMMPKLAKVARVLGPRGLMPNPKNGTISENPEEAMKKFQGGQISFKTEAKTPLIHLSVGKTSFENEKLTDNIKTIVAAVKKDRIRKITLKSTMSPAIRLQV